MKNNKKRRMRRRIPTKQYNSLDTNAIKVDRPKGVTDTTKPNLGTLKQFNILSHRIKTERKDTRLNSISVSKLGRKLDLPPLPKVPKNNDFNMMLPTIASAILGNKETSKLSSERLPRPCNDKINSLPTGMRKREFQEENPRLCGDNSIMELLTQRDSQKRRKEKKEQRVSLAKKRVVKLESIDIKKKPLGGKNERKQVARDMSIDHISIILASHSSKMNAMLGDEDTCFAKRGNINSIDKETIGKAFKRPGGQCNKSRYLYISTFYEDLYQKRLKEQNSNKKVRFNDICSLRKLKEKKLKENSQKGSNKRGTNKKVSIKLQGQTKTRKSLQAKKRKIDSMISLLNEEKTAYLQKSRLDDIIAKKSLFKHIN